METEHTKHNIQLSPEAKAASEELRTEIRELLSQQNISGPEELNSLLSKNTLPTTYLEALKVKLQSLNIVLATGEVPPELKVMTPERVKRIMGEDFFSVESIEETFDIQIDREKIPQIPFSRTELERAHELGLFLILRMDRSANGDPLTMENMIQILQPGYTRKGKGKILYANNLWCKSENFFKQETPRVKWALVSKDILTGTNNRDYLEQTELVEKYLQQELYQAGNLPVEYQEAIEEFNREKGLIAMYISRAEDKDYQLLAAEKLSKLKITQFTRHTVVELLYDFAVYFNCTNNRLLKNKSDSTMTRTIFGAFTELGPFMEKGTMALSSLAHQKDRFTGVVLSLTK